MKNSPTLRILTGPVNSGKTALLEALIKKMRKKQVKVLQLKSGSLSFNSVESLVANLMDNTCTWLDDFKQAADHFQLAAASFGGLFRTKVKIAEKPDMPPVAK